MNSMNKVRKYGKNHHSYREIPEEERLKRRRKFLGYKTWCKSCYSRFNYTCQKCYAYNKTMKENGGIEAHHIKSFVDYPTLRLSVNNSICMCHKCHTEFHKQYGYENFTIENLEEYLNCKFIGNLAD